jgi:PAS domain S-box-containing protein
VVENAPSGEFVATSTGSAHSLRQRAEEVLRRQPQELNDVPPADLQHLIHELQVHQIELEMQNEELHRTQLEMELARDRYLDLYDFAPVGYFTLSEAGLIQQANLTAATMLGVDRARLIRQRFSRFILNKDQDIDYLHRRKLFETQSPQAWEIRMVKQNGSRFWARIEAAVAVASDGQAVCRATMSDSTELVRVEEALRKERDFLTSVLEALSHPFYVINADDYGIQIANRAARLEGRLDRGTCYALLHGQTEPCATDEQPCLLERVKRTKEPEIAEHVHFDAEGQARHLEIHGYPLFDGEGEVARIIEYCLDVTERRQAEEDLLKLTHALGERVKELNCLYGISRLSAKQDTSLDEILRETLNLIPPAFQVPEIACARIIWADREFRTQTFEKTNWKLDADLVVHGERIGSLEVYYLEERPELGEAPFLVEERSLIHAIAERLGRTAERLRAENGVRQARDELQQRVEERTAELVQSSQALQDEALERRRVEHELYASDERFRQMAENIHEVLWLVDPQTNQLLYISPAYEAVWDRSRQSRHTLSDAFLEGIHMEDRAPVLAAIEDVSQEHEVEFRIVRPDGAQRWIRSRAFPIHDAQGKIYRIAGIAEDITDRKQAQAALVQAERLAMAGQLAASLAHEINNPLQSVVGCLDLGLEALDVGTDVRPFLQVAAEASARAAGVVAQLRALHRRSQLEEKELANLNTLLEKVLILARRQCETSRVEVVRQAGSDLPALPLMPSAIQQVFLNLMLNAIEAMPQGGKLGVRTKRTEQPQGVSVEFADRGTGMPPEMLEHPFEPFHTTKPDGLGLGLFISQNIVQQHGGNLSAQNRPGGGTKVTVWLPL